MRLTSKGQVTIPIDIRFFLGLEPGDEVEFVIEDDNTVRVQRGHKTPDRGRRIVEHLLSGPRPDIPMTTDEIMALMRGD